MNKGFYNVLTKFHNNWCQKRGEAYENIKQLYNTNFNERRNKVLKKVRN